MVNFHKADSKKPQTLRSLSHKLEQHPIWVEKTNSLSEKYALLEVGFTNGVNQFSTGLNTAATYSFTASLIKAADCFIGSEGGLANLAAGVGTKTIITGDFVHQLYGWNGVIKK